MLCGTIALLALFLVAGARPAAAQIDISGMWAPIYQEDQVERVAGPDIGDYLGLPITEAARARALAWDASILTLPEHQCKPHPSTYGFRGVGNLRIWPEFDDQTERTTKLVTSIVEDPTYLTGELVTSSHFKREPDGAKWSPMPCREK